MQLNVQNLGPLHFSNVSSESYWSLSQADSGPWALFFIPLIYVTTKFILFDMQLLWFFFPVLIKIF